MDHVESAQQSRLTSRAMIHRNIPKSLQEQLNCGFAFAANKFDTNKADKLSLSHQQKGTISSSSSTTGLQQNEDNRASEDASGRRAPIDESFTITAPIVEPIGNIAGFESTISHTMIIPVTQPRPVFQSRLDGMSLMHENAIAARRYKEKNKFWRSCRPWQERC